MLEPPKEQPKILQGSDEIKQAFQWGDDRLAWWRKQPGFPAKIVCGRLTCHKIAVEEFIKGYLTLAT